MIAGCKRRTAVAKTSPTSLPPLSSLLSSISLVPVCNQWLTWLIRQNNKNQHKALRRVTEWSCFPQAVAAEDKGGQLGQDEQSFRSKFQSPSQLRCFEVTVSFEVFLKAYSTCIRCRSTYWLAVTKLTMAELTHKSHQELRRGWKGNQNESQFENVSQNDRLPPLSDIEVHLCKTWQFYDFFNTKKEMGTKLIQHQNIQNWKRVFSQCF